MNNASNATNATLAGNARLTAKRPGKLHDVANMLKAVLGKWNDDKVPELAAALSYYMFFSMAPLLIISIAIAGLIFGQQTVQTNFIGQIQSLAGQDAANTVSGIIQSLDKPAASIPGAILGLIALIFGALGVFGEIKGALNFIWRVPPRPSGGFFKDILRTVREEFVLFSMVLVTGFLLLVSLLLNTILIGIANIIQAQIGDPLSAAATFWSVIDFILSFVLTTLLFAAIYKILP